MRFPIKLGARNGGNSRVIRGLSNGIIRDAFAGTWWWVQQVKRGDFVLAGATSQVITMSSTYPNNLFPEKVTRKQALIGVERVFAGGAIATATAELGDTGDPNGIVEASDIFTGTALLGGYAATFAAAQQASRFEDDYSGDGLQMIIRTTAANLSACTSRFSLWAMIEFTPAAMF